MEMAYQLTRSAYKKQSVSLNAINAKIEHYSTVIRSEALYAAECLGICRKYLNEKLESKERTVLKIIM